MGKRIVLVVVIVFTVILGGMLSLTQRHLQTMKMEIEALKAQNQSLESRLAQKIDNTYVTAIDAKVNGQQAELEALEAVAETLSSQVPEIDYWQEEEVIRNARFGMNILASIGNVRVERVVLNAFETGETGEITLKYRDLDKDLPQSISLPANLKCYLKEDEQLKPYLSSEIEQLLEERELLIEVSRYGKEFTLLFVDDQIRGIFQEVIQ